MADMFLHFRFWISILSSSCIVTGIFIISPSIAPSMITLKYKQPTLWTVVVVVDTASIVMAWVVVTTTRSFTVGCAVFGRRRLSSGSVDDLISLSLCTSFREFVAAATSFLLPSMTAASYESHISSIATSRVVSNVSICFLVRKGCPVQQ